MDKKETVSIAYHGNIVDLLQYAVDNNIKIELLSGPDILPCTIRRRILPAGSDL